MTPITHPRDLPETEAARHLRATLSRRLMLADGAIGTALLALPGSSIAQGRPESLNSLRPEWVAGIHRAYIDAGAEIITTNTFSGGLEGVPIARAVVETRRNALPAPARPIWVAGSLGPIQHATDNVYADRVSGMLTYGADVILAETFFEGDSLNALLRGVDMVSRDRGARVPLILTLTTTRRDASSLAGYTPPDLWRLVAPHAPIALGINCAFGPEPTRPLLEALAEACPCPIAYRPSAGLPDDGPPLSPDQFAAAMGKILSPGRVSLIGGCCGTTPAHIAALSRMIPP